MDDKEKELVYKYLEEQLEDLDKKQVFKIGYRVGKLIKSFEMLEKIGVD